MKASKRLNTNQTNNSNKKSSQIAHDNPSFQLPKIQKTSNYETNSNMSYDLDFNDDKSGRYALDEIQENQREEVGVVNYQKMTMEEIKLEYQRLRDEVSKLSSQIRKKQELFQSKIMKKQQSRISNPVQTQRKLAQTQQQVYENSQLLNKLRIEYQHLQKRSNLANSSISRPNAQMNDKILTLRQKILNAKEKIKLLKKKTKKGGNDIVNGQNIHEVFQKLQRQQKALESRQANLQGKIDESKYKIERQDQKLSEIQRTYSDAQDYLKLFKLQNEENQQKNSLAQEWKQRIHRQQVIRRKMQSDQQTNLQKYHQLLKLFEINSQKQAKMDKKLIDEDIKILKARNSILDLERQWEELQQIVQRFNEQQGIRKQAQILRKAIEKNDTFMTQNGFVMTSNSMNSHMVGVRSIIEENQSDIRDTIQNIQINDNQTIPNISNNNKVRVKTKDKFLFTRIQDKSDSVPKKQNKGNVTAKIISDQSRNFTDAKYYLSSKEINKKREQQKNIPTLRKQGSTNQSKNGRKVYSLIKPNDATKLKQLSMNRTATKQVKQIRIPNIKNNQKQRQSLPQTAKQPYIAISRNIHEKQIHKGKQVLRQRKSSLKIVTKIQTEEKQQVKKNLLQELDQINRQLLSDTQPLSQVQLLQKTKPLYEKQPTADVSSSKQLTRAQLSGKIIKPSSKQGRVVKPESKQGKIRHQPNAIKFDVLQEIDKRNIQYTRKIQQMKRQLIDKQQNGYQITQKKYSQSNTKLILTEEQQQAIEQQTQQTPYVMENIPSLQNIPPTNQPSLLTANLKDQSSQSELSQDDDIEQDISQINKMIKKKLQDQGIKAE